MKASIKLFKFPAPELPDELVLVLELGVPVPGINPLFMMSLSDMVDRTSVSVKCRFVTNIQDGGKIRR